ncbi:OsmC family protein [Mycobacterium sp. OAE908]|uniref:OsmC family protein n=1 Tax=Mycobacterium sp. OAE908 TaxID=2817899 RepID=UPI001AE2FE59
MDAAALRDLQAPLKRRYRDDPGSSRTPLTAEAFFETDGVTALVQTWSGPARAGLHPATGGDGEDACSGDMLLQALLACAGVTMRSVATAMGVDISGAELRATGMFDARGTLGIDREVPVGVQDISIVAELQTDADDSTLAKLAELTERYCVVGQSLARIPSIRVTRTGASTNQAR